MTKKMYVITGPTASGKSALAVQLAQQLGTEIISADSRQIYKGIPIVTAMPTEEERALVRHHLIDRLPLDTYYSASQFEQDALRIGRDVMNRYGSVVVCGGSMMYVDALCNGIDDLPTVPDDIRQGLMAEHSELGDTWLLETLRELDPEYYSIVDKRNIKRVFHAVEIIRTAGKSYTQLRTGQKRERPFLIEKYMITMPREQLFDRINRRVDAMIEAGLEEEARSVYPLRALNSLNTVGLKELFSMFEGEMDRHTAISRIKKNTRVYAKKQMTWWARDREIIPLDSNVSPDAILSYHREGR
ncbi:MAG: tRNA (adenosine(37)-N6)-dimethylallyltransferase MiaA [Muribaculaceae bacterium]|nr:tRNA (adenosine(37)-N6)-dimethylallyltransferase MiaA [Muribaculaceae bacterium]